MTNDHDNDTAAAIAAGQSLASKVIEVADLHGTKVGSFLMRACDMVAEDLERFMPAPRRVVQQVTAKTTKGFIDYINEFGDGNESIGFLNPTAPNFGVIFDYHGSTAAPGWCKHRVGFAPARSAVFAAWVAMCGRALKQTELADFIEDHAGEIAIPASAVLLELVQKFSATSEVAFSSAINQANGTVQFAYSENVNKGNALTAPSELTIVASVFDGEPAQNIKIKFRYKVTDGKLGITLAMVRLDEILRIAIEKIGARIVADTKNNVRVWIEGATE